MQCRLRSPRITYISRAARLCLLGLVPSRSSCRRAWRHSSVPPLVPLDTASCFVLALRLVPRHVLPLRRTGSGRRLCLRRWCVSCSCPLDAVSSRSLPLACLPRVPHRHGSSYRLPPRVPSLPAHRPADRVEQAGRHLVRGVSACLACGAVLI